ncbi:MAG: HEAT repeat domain-containing protein, partial [Verrucomicrobiota bacterium]
PLDRHLNHSAAEVRAEAMKLVGLWEVKALRRRAINKAIDLEEAPSVREAAIEALGQLGGPESVEALTGLTHRVDAIGALLKLEPALAKVAAARMFVWNDNDVELQELYGVFAAREGGSALLAEPLAERADEARAKRWRELWVATGLVDESLSRMLDDLAGVAPLEMEFSESLVRELAKAGRSGNADHGKTLFHSANLGCVACHKVGETGGVIGPDLSGLGSGIEPERITTEVVWPARQVKEGYSLSRITMKDGTVQQGYLQKSRDKKILLLRDFATGDLHQLDPDSVAKKESIGSLMPPTAAGLDRKDLADLLAYLFDLGRS